MLWQDSGPHPEGIQAKHAAHRGMPGHLHSKQRTSCQYLCIFWGTSLKTPVSTVVSKFEMVYTTSLRRTGTLPILRSSRRGLYLQSSLAVPCFWGSRECVAAQGIYGTGIFTTSKPLLAGGSPVHTARDVGESVSGDLHSLGCMDQHFPPENKAGQVIISELCCLGCLG